MTNQKTKGNHGEQLACDYLQNHGYHILNRNYHEKCGEIDIIAQYENIIIFAEVKTRKLGAKISGLEAVNLSKRKKIIKTAYKYILKNDCKLQPRFDVIEIYVDNKNFVLNHIKNAFILEANDYELF